MKQAHTDAATLASNPPVVEFRTPDGKNAVFVYATQVFAVTVLNSSGVTAVIGPANATMLVEGTAKEASERVVAALMQATKQGEL